MSERPEPSTPTLDALWDDGVSAYWQGKNCQVWYPNLILQSRDPNIDEIRKILANAPRKEASDTTKDTPD